MTHAPPPSTDLEIVRAGVHSILAPRAIAGPTLTRSDARTNGDLWRFAGSAEDGVALSELDKARAVTFVDSATAIIEKARLGTCSFFNVKCRMAKRRPVK